jgi:hypothetical protein
MNQRPHAAITIEALDSLMYAPFAPPAPIKIILPGEYKKIPAPPTITKTPNRKPWYARYQKNPRRK